MSRSICFSNRVYRRRRSNRLSGWSLTKPISPQRPTSGLSPSGTPCPTCGSFSRRDLRHGSSRSQPPSGMGHRSGTLATCHRLRPVKKRQRPDKWLDRGSGDGAPSYTSCRSRLRPATFLAVSRVIEKKCATPSGWLTKDDGENGRRDRQAALDAADLRRRGAAIATRLGYAGTVGRGSPVHLSVRILTTDITDTTDKRIQMRCVMRPDGD
jgi:hypothetical protein